MRTVASQCAGFLERLAAPAGQRHGVARRQKGQGHGPADAAARARNQHHLAHGSSSLRATYIG